MRIKHYNKGKKPLGQRPDYSCYRNDGLQDIIHHHSNSISVHVLDDAAWRVALEYIRKPELVRQRVEEIRREHAIDTHSDIIKEKLANAEKRAHNINLLAETANDEDTITNLQRRLAEIEKEKRDLRALLFDAEEQEEVQEKILAEVAKFEDWAYTVQPLLGDPYYEPSYEEKRLACVILGIQATIYPSSTTERIQIDVAPPSILRVVSPILPGSEVDSGSSFDTVYQASP